MIDLTLISDPRTWFKKEEPSEKKTVVAKNRFKFKFWCISEKRFVNDPEINGSGEVSCMDGISGSDNCTDDIVVCQWTGLKDVDGRDIYEGDIVKAHPSETFDVGFVDGSFIIYFNNLNNYNTLAQSLINAWKLTVIGNKFQV